MILSYFARLSSSKLILWCYLAWYAAIVTMYFEASPILWISSAGISIFIGFALNLATWQPGQKVDPWVTFRLFLIPFCVSSYAALIKGRGFILLFPSDLRSLLIASGCCVAVVAFHLVCRSFLSGPK